MYNKATLVGRLARDPEMREFSNGGGVCKIRLITSTFWRDRESGEMKEKPEGHNVSVYVEKMARRIADACRKGDVILVEGMIETRKWTTPEGETRYITEISVRPFQGTVRRMPVTRPHTQTDERIPTDATREVAVAADGVEGFAGSGDVFEDWESDGMSSLDGDGDFPF